MCEEYESNQEAPEVETRQDVQGLFAVCLRLCVKSRGLDGIHLETTFTY